MNENIFDLKKIDDLDHAIRQQLSRKTRYGKFIYLMAVDLFDIKSILSVDEFLVGYCRKYDVIKTRIWASVILNDLVSRNLIKRVKDMSGGTIAFEKIKDNKDE